MNSLSTKISECIRHTANQDVPCLVFFKDEILRRANQLSDFCRQNRIELYFAIKSCSHPTFLDLIHGFIDGFDVSNVNELQTVSRYKKNISLYNPSPGANFYKSLANQRVDIVKENGESISNNGLKLLRVDPTALYPNKTVSRFGCPIDLVGQMDNVDGVHFHLREIHEYSLSDFLDIIRYIQARKPNIKIINLGGGWHKLEGGGQHFRILSSIRSAFPDLRLRIEPGRYFSYDSGFAVGTITNISRTKQHITTNLSSILHLNWCEPQLWTNSESEADMSVQIFGPTCFEYDAIGSYHVGHNWWDGARVHDKIVFTGLSTYTIERQAQFNGIKAVEVKFI